MDATTVFKVKGSFEISKVVGFNVVDAKLVAATVTADSGVAEETAKEFAAVSLEASEEMGPEFANVVGSDVAGEEDASVKIALEVLDSVVVVEVPDAVAEDAELSVSSPDADRTATLGSSACGCDGAALLAKATTEIDSEDASGLLVASTMDAVADVS